MKKRKLIFVISSPSGGGKTTICGMVLKKIPGLKRSVSVTSRQPRKGEKPNVDYYFVGKEEFLKKIKENAFAEWAKVLDNYYGTLKKNIERSWKQGRDVILNIDIQGALRIKKVYSNETVLMFILPPSFRVLKERLVNRNTDGPDEIKKRLTLAKKELPYAQQYDYTVVNDSLNKAVNEVESIIVAERCKVR
ncbi:MAG: guanylate kinase [Candidatus Omnitrophota bacterium]